MVAMFSALTLFWAIEQNYHFRCLSLNAFTTFYGCNCGNFDSCWSIAKLHSSLLDFKRLSMVAIFCAMTLFGCLERPGLAARRRRSPSGLGDHHTIQAVKA